VKNPSKKAEASMSDEVKGTSREGHFPRRRFLEGTLGAAAMVTVSSAVARADEPPVDRAASPKKPALGAKGAPSFADLDPDKVTETYRSRRFAELSDRQIVDAVAAIVARPGEGMTSFTLHAPLELLARSGLLPLVAPEDRELARTQMVASAAAYQAGVQPVREPPVRSEYRDFASAGRDLTQAFAKADPDGLEAVVLQVARQFGTASLVHSLTPLLLPTLTAASHSHIGLWLLLRHGAGDAGDASLLRAATRSLAQDPQGRMASFGGMALSAGKPSKLTPQQIEREIFSRLAHPLHSTVAPGGGIRGLMEAAEKGGTVDLLFADFIAQDLDPSQIAAAFRSILRVSAHGMLQDDPGEAKFGWSHFFTLPQAACGLSSLHPSSKLGLATTLVWSTAYRTVLSSRRLDFQYRPKAVQVSLAEALHAGPDVAAARFYHADPSEFSAMQRLLASEASVRNDQHLVKYTRACFDMCGFDPPGARLYLAAAAKLAGLWIAEVPREKIPGRYLEGRSTPGRATC
jgi:hypothetical protein